MPQDEVLIYSLLRSYSYNSLPVTCVKGNITL